VRIRRATGPGASPLPGRNNNHNEQVPDDTIKQLETFGTGPLVHDTAVLPFPTKPTDPSGSTRGGAA
jgi:hypothetical protein